MKIGRPYPGSSGIAGTIVLSAKGSSGEMIAKLRRKIFSKIEISDKLNVAPFEVSGTTFRIPCVDGYFCRIDEPWMISLIRVIMQFKHGRFIDVGVNLGQTLLAVKAIRPQQEYVGFEPNPLCVAYVEKMVKINDINGCRIIPVGIATHSNILALSLYHDKSTDSSASLIEGFRPSLPSTSQRFVAVAPFEQAREAMNLDSADIVKIDVEGFESEVFSSMLPSIKAWRPWVITEILPCTPDVRVERFERQEEYEKLLASAGYLKYRIIKDAKGDYLGVEAIDKIGIHENLAWCDYLCVPEEQVSLVEERLSPRAVGE